MGTGQPQAKSSSCFVSFGKILDIWAGERVEGLEAEVGTSAEKGGGGIHTLQTAHICVYTLQVAAARTKTHGCRWTWGLKLDPEQTPTG